MNHVLPGSPSSAMATKCRHKMQWPATVIITPRHPKPWRQGSWLRSFIPKATESCTKTSEQILFCQTIKHHRKLEALFDHLHQQLHDHNGFNWFCSFRCSLSIHGCIFLIDPMYIHGKYPPPNYHKPWSMSSCECFLPLNVRFQWKSWEHPWHQDFA